MMNKACQHCKIFFPNSKAVIICPICLGTLKSIQDDSSFQPCDWDTVNNIAVPIVNSEKKAKKNSDISKEAASQIQTAPLPVQASPKRSAKKSFEVNRDGYSGVITGYDRTEVSDQSIPEAVGMFFRGLHTGHTRHIITFVDENDHNTYKVCFYGEFVAAGSAMIAVGDRIFVKGRLSGTTFFSENVIVEGARIRLRSQHDVDRNSSMNPILFLLTIGIALLIAFSLKFILSGGLAFISELATSFIVISLIGLVVISMLVQRPLGRWMIIASTVIGAVGTAVIYNIGGAGEVFRSIMNSTGQMIIIVVCIVFILRKLLK